ncbi:MAG: DNA-methyltransferase [Methanoregula sp.]
MTEHRIIQGDVLEGLKMISSNTVHCVCTSPPYYGLRNYGVEGQIGLEETPEDFVKKITEVFREVRRVLRDDGTLWLNFGDSYSGSPSTAGAAINPDSISYKSGQTRGGVSKPIGIVPGLKAKDMIGIPWRVAFALQADGWYLRSDIIWNKPNPMPESVTDRPTKSHEYIFLLTKSARYFYDADAIREEATTHEDRPFGCDRARSYDGKLNLDENAPEQFKKKANKQDQTGNPTYTGLNERWKGKHSDQDPQSAGARMLLNAKRAREETGSHDAMFGHRKQFDPTQAWGGSNVIGHSGNLDGCDGITRNARTVWTITTQARPEAHFATFPDEIPRRCISAGTSERGCCPKCGKPWERVVEVTGGTIGESWHPHADDEVTGQVGGFPSKGYKREFKGWKPGCSCDAGESVPCIVLDPFLGSGTTMRIARDLGRSSIGIEINPAYIKIARKLLQTDSQLDTGAVNYRFEKVIA